MFGIKYQTTLVRNVTIIHIKLDAWSEKHDQIYIKNQMDRKNKEINQVRLKAFFQEKQVFMFDFLVLAWPPCV